MKRKIINTAICDARNVTEESLAGYKCRTKFFPLSDVANYEKHVPDEWINDEGNDILGGFIDYAMPLIQDETPMQKKFGLPDFAQLKKVLAE